MSTDTETARRDLNHPPDPAHRRLSAVDTPSVAEGRGVPQEELLEAAENALNWLYDRRAHLPEELLDHREAKHRKALREALGSLASLQALGDLDG